MRLTIGLSTIKNIPQSKREQDRSAAHSPSTVSTPGSSLELTTITTLDLNAFILELCNVLTKPKGAEGIPKKTVHEIMKKKLPIENGSNKAQLTLIDLLKLTIQWQYNLQLLRKKQYPLEPLSHYRLDLIAAIRSTVGAASSEVNFETKINDIFAAMPMDRSQQSDKAESPSPSPSPSEIVTAEQVRKTILGTLQALDKKITERKEQVAKQQSAISALKSNSVSASHLDNGPNQELAYSSFYINTQAKNVELSRLKSFLLPENQELFVAVLNHNKLNIIATQYLQQWPTPVHKWFFGSHTHQPQAQKLLKQSSSQDPNYINIEILRLLNLERSEEEEKQEIASAITKLSNFDKGTRLAWLALSLSTTVGEGKLHQDIKKEFSENFKQYDRPFARHCRDISPAIPRYNSWLKRRLSDELTEDLAQTHQYSPALRTQ